MIANYSSVKPQALEQRTQPLSRSRRAGRAHGRTGEQKRSNERWRPSSHHPGSLDRNAGRNDYRNFILRSSRKSEMNRGGRREALAQLGANRACLFALDGRRRFTRNCHPMFVVMVRRTRLFKAVASNPDNDASPVNPMAAAGDQMQPFAQASYQTEQGDERPNDKASKSGGYHGLLRPSKRSRQNRHLEILSQPNIGTY